MGIIYSYNDLQGKIKVGDKVRAVPGHFNPCGQLQDDGLNIREITDVSATGFNINGCSHTYSSRFVLELVTANKTLDDITTLEVGNELVDGDDDTRTILGICGRVLLLSDYEDPETFDTGYTVEEVQRKGWKLKGESAVTQMTVAEVEAKLGHKVEIIADK